MSEAMRRPFVEPKLTEEAQLAEITLTSNTSPRVYDRHHH